MVRTMFASSDPLDRAFEVGIILKGLDGILEVVGGLLLLLVSPATINQVAKALTQHELSGDLHDFLATLWDSKSTSGSNWRTGIVAQ